MALTLKSFDLLKDDGESSYDGITCTRIFVATFDDSSAQYTFADALVATHASKPALGSAHPNIPGICLQSIVPSLGDSSLGTPISADGRVAGTVLYTLTYKPRPIPYDDKYISPTLRPARIEWGGSEETEVRRYDVDGNPFVNSAGEPYDNLPDMYVRGASCTITRNEASNPAALVDLYSFTSNLNSWYGVGEGNGVIGKITASLQSEVNIFTGAAISYWQVTYPIKFKRDGFKYKTFDIGYRQVDANGDEIHAAFDKNGVQNVQPVFLDGHGAIITPQLGATPVEWPDLGGPKGWKVIEESDWGSLSLPNPFI